MKKRLSFKAFREEALSDKPCNTEYEALRPEFELLEQLIKARKKAKLSQAELAQRLNIQQPSIARLEKGGYSSTSIATLSRVADALGYSIKISLRAKKRV